VRPRRTSLLLGSILILVSNFVLRTQTVPGIEEDYIAILGIEKGNSGAADESHVTSLNVTT
jgi:hypothetical protein